MWLLAFLTKFVFRWAWALDVNHLPNFHYFTSFTSLLNFCGSDSLWPAASQTSLPSIDYSSVRDLLCFLICCFHIKTSWGPHVSVFLLLVEKLFWSLKLQYHFQWQINPDLMKQIQKSLQPGKQSSYSSDHEVFGASLPERRLCQSTMTCLSP